MKHPELIEALHEAAEQKAATIWESARSEAEQCGEEAVRSVESRRQQAEQDLAATARQLVEAAISRGDAEARTIRMATSHALAERAYRLASEALPKGSMDRAVQTAVLKSNSFVNQLNLQFYRGHTDQKITIKLEVDANPPAGAGFEYTYKDFPTDFEVCHQDLSSNFALKIHALLCRPYFKGRDWYDFNWYIRQGVSPNLPHLRNALVQYGLWEGQDDLFVDDCWLREELRKKIDSIEWEEAAEDVAPFLKAGEQESLKLWNSRFFEAKLERLA